MAGSAAALFAANRGVDVAQVGVTGEMIFASGLLDLMGVHPLEEGKTWLDPWAGIDRLTREAPNHPYARLKKEDIRTAFDEVLSCLQDSGLPYLRRKEKNSEMPTPLGRVKQTYCVPKSMWGGAKALERKRPCLIVGFRELNDFSAELIAASLQHRWPSLRTARLSLGEAGLFNGPPAGEIMARSFESARARERFVQSVLPRLRDAEAIGAPAVLGLTRTNEIIEELEDRLGVAVFEIPTLPISIPGLRLDEAFKRALSSKGVALFQQKRVAAAPRKIGDGFELVIGGPNSRCTLKTKGVVLASGRFWGRGLCADRKGVRETIFDLPVHQPKGRRDWHRKDFVDRRGHPVNRAGLEVDDMFRPLSNSSRPAHDSLFCAGSILAHQDWMRMKCGSGLAVSTAYGAVKAYLKLNA